MIIKIKKAQLNQIIMIIVGLVILITIILGVTIITNNVIGANITNQTVTTKVYVWNTEPVLNSVVITPDPIVLSADSTAQVNCTGNFFDYNGWQDVGINGSVNATLYHVGLSNASAPDDNNFHYTNNSCVGNTSCSQVNTQSLNGTNGTCTCTFNVEYYAINGTWACNMTIRDAGINITDPSRKMTFNASKVGTAYLAELIGLNMPSEINFGNLSVTEVSTWIVENITNTGNIEINISAYAFGGDNESAAGANSTVMLCALGNITHGYMRYTTINGTDFSKMFNITFNSTNPPPIYNGNLTNFSQLSIPIRTNDNSTTLGEDVNQTFWRLEVPLSVGGNCNGTIVFSANKA
jgi:hypothetical protein